MNLTEAYLYLFFDNLLGSLILPIHTSFVEIAMLVFGTYDISYIFFFATLGEILGHWLNIILGRILTTIRKKDSAQEEENFLTILYKKYFYFTLLTLPIFFLNSLNSVLIGAFGKHKITKYLRIVATAIIIYRTLLYLL